MSDLAGLGVLFGNLLGFGANMTSAASSYKAQLAANRANMRMNKYNINTAQQMFDKQMAYNREMYEDQKAYNSASAQRQRLESAGLNPYMMMNGGDAGSVTASSAPSYSQPSMIPMQAASFNLDSTPLVNAASAFYDKKLKESQINKLDAEASTAWQNAEYTRTFNEIQVVRSIADLEGVSQENKSKMIDNYIKQNTAGYAIQSAKYDTDFKFQQIRNLSLDAAIKEAGLPYISHKARLEVDNLASDLLSKQKQRDLNDAQIQDLYASVLLKNKQRLNMPNLTPKQADELAKYMVQSAQGAAEEAGWSASIRGFEREEMYQRGRFSNILKRIGGALDAVNPLKAISPVRIK